MQDPIDPDHSETGIADPAYLTRRTVISHVCVFGLLGLASGNTIGLLAGSAIAPQAEAAGYPIPNDSPWKFINQTTWTAPD